jgi:AhpD family alkylhydroperoxidase
MEVLSPKNSKRKRLTPKNSKRKRSNPVASPAVERAENVPHEHDTSLEDFVQFRARLNVEILNEGNLVINRFFALDTRTYEAGALDVRTKELLGLVASLVLRCDDCVTYHLTRCAEERVTRAEIFECLSVGLVVGGSIVIPHLRRAVDRWSELESLAN